MATAANCPRCGERHWHFQKCRVKENQKEGLSYWKLKPNLPEGQRLWGQDILDEYERRGNLIVRRSGMKLRPHLGTVTEPEEKHD